MSILPDVQNNNINGKKINKVGIREIYSEVEFNKKVIPGNFSVYVSLIDTKGIHMSRLSQVILEKSPIKINKEYLRGVLDELEKRSGDFCEDYYIKVSFDYLRKVFSPVTKLEHSVRVPIKVKVEKKNKQYKFYLETKVYYTSLCPCSKEISKYGAHNQRSEAIIVVELKDMNYFEAVHKIIDIVENNASCRIYELLKRPDEKYVTEKAYENPRFVEDMSRRISNGLYLILDKNIRDFSAIIGHDESIHQHQAVSFINAGRKLN